MRVTTLLTLLTVLCWVAGPSVLAQQPGRPLSWDELQTRMVEEAHNLAPIAGHVVLSFRESSYYEAPEVVVFDSAQPGSVPQGGPVTLPCWLPLVAVLQADGLKDGHGDAYTGPLMVTFDPQLVRILGPYPEGFVVAKDGRFRVSFLPRGLPFADHEVYLSVVYRTAYPRVEVNGQRYPLAEDWETTPPPEEPVTGFAMHFSQPDHDRGEFPPVATSVVGGQRTLTAKARFFLPGGQPARSLPVRFWWRFAEELQAHDQEATHDALTDPEGWATDTHQVPAAIAKGQVEIWVHDDGKDYGHATTTDFDFTQAQ